MISIRFFFGAILFYLYEMFLGDWGPILTILRIGIAAFTCFLVLFGLRWMCFLILAANIVSIKTGIDIDAFNLWGFLVETLFDCRMPTLELIATIITSFQCFIAIGVLGLFLKD